MPLPAKPRAVPEPPAVRAARPRNRRLLIARAAALAFSERGYHGVSMEEIAAEVGISAPALYRHYSGKYQLFLEAALQMVQQLLDATAEDALPAAAGPEERLEHLVDAVVAVTLANRGTGSIYRHEARYLSAADHARLWARFDELTRRVLVPLTAVRPQLTESQARFLSVGAFGMIASITAHHTVLAPRRIEAVLRASAAAVLRFPLPDEECGGGNQRYGSGRFGEPGRSNGAGTAGASAGSTEAPPAQPRKELLLTQAVRLFYRKGYRETGIEEVGAAAGVTASAVYRHFPGKSALLLQACHRAADRLAAATAEALAPADGPEEALVALIGAYVRHTFAHHELMFVYFADALNLSEAERAQLRILQRRHIRIWVGLLARLRPDLGAAEVRFLVHGALNMTADLGRFTRFDQSAANRERITGLILQALGVPG